MSGISGWVAHRLLIWNQIVKELKEFKKIFGSPKLQNFEPDNNGIS